MTRDYLVVYEKGENNWSAFSPDVLGCGALGDTIEETRAEMGVALELYIDRTTKSGEPIPEAHVSSVNFAEFDPEHETKQYMVEWLPVNIPEPIYQRPAYGLRALA